MIRLQIIIKKLSYATLVSTTDFSVRRAFNIHCIWMHPDRGALKYTAVGLEYVPFAEARPVNGVLVEITDTKMEEIIKREKGYNYVTLPILYFVCQTPICSEELVSVFIPEGPQYPTEEYPVRQEYVDICISGFSKCSDAYATLFIETTFWGSNIDVVAALDTE